MRLANSQSHISISARFKFNRITFAHINVITHSYCNAICHNTLWICLKHLNLLQKNSIHQSETNRTVNECNRIDWCAGVCMCVCVVVWANFYHKNMHQFEIKLAVFPLKRMISVYIAVAEYIRLLSVHPSISLSVLLYMHMCVYLCKCKICIYFFLFSPFWQ